MKTPIEFLNEPLNSNRSLTTDCPVWPYLSYYIYHIENKLPKAYGSALETQSVIISGFATNLAARITNVANNVLITEKQIFEKTILGREMETSSYYKLVSENKSYLTDIIKAYPELDRVLTKLSQNFVEFTLQFFTDLIEDRQEINEVFNIGSDVNLSAIDVSASETHYGSRTVCTLSFNFIKIVTNQEI
ncbi:DUF4135 domain-containing protein [Pseudomonas sp. B26140]|uniref:DUF4135 domain-containing protein n=1 Tax=Pseudomonas sp. B26140 TaxID=3235112 RepID=UPI0037830B57